MIAVFIVVLLILIHVFDNLSEPERGSDAEDKEHKE